MTESVGRVFLGLSALAVLWIIVYWWWEPSRVTFDPGGGVSLKSASGMNPAAQPGENPRTGGETTKPAHAPEADQPQRIAVIPPRFQNYTVKQGDTIESIAAKELGSSKHAAAILRANSLMSPEHLKAGRVIRIPLDPTNIQGKPAPSDVPVVVAAQPKAPQADPPAAPAAATGATPEQPSKYVVKAGDSLSAISKKFYGTTSLSDFIFEP